MFAYINVKPFSSKLFAAYKIEICISNPHNAWSSLWLKKGSLHFGTRKRALVKKAFVKMALMKSRQNSPNAAKAAIFHELWTFWFQCKRSTLLRATPFFFIPKTKLFVRFWILIIIIRKEFFVCAPHISQWVEFFAILAHVYICGFLFNFKHAMRTSHLSFCISCVCYACTNARRMH